MSFRIPTLEEARKKHDEKVSLVNGQVHMNRACKSTSSSLTTVSTSSRPSAATATQSSTDGSHGVGTVSVGRSQQGQKRPVVAVTNPYARKTKKPAALSGDDSEVMGKSCVGRKSTATQSQQRQAGTKENVTTRSKPWNHNRFEQSSSIRSLPGGSDPLDVGTYATFSQAFGSIEDTEHYAKEASALRQTSSSHGLSLASNDNDDRQRAEQRAFDAAAVAAETHAHGNANTNTTPSNTSPTNTTTSARDNHALLQPHVLHVSTRQRGNGLLRYIRNVPFAYAKIVPDYIMGTNRCALFLSIRYHNLHPQYIHRRIAELRSDFDLRILLCLVDVEDNAPTLLYLNKIAVVNNMTLILSWSEEEAARYLETYKSFEGKDATLIQRREQSNFADQIADVLGTVRSVNKTDAAQLLVQFGNLRSLVMSSMEELILCPGIGEKKVRRLYDAFHKPFSSAAVAAKKRMREEKKEQEEEEEKEKEHYGKRQEDANGPSETYSGVTVDRREDNVRNNDNGVVPSTDVVGADGIVEEKR